MLLVDSNHLPPELQVSTLNTHPLTSLLIYVYTLSKNLSPSGMLLVGSEVNFLQFIPPEQDLFTSLGHCTSECTQAGLPDSGIQ